MGAMMNGLHEKMSETRNNYGGDKEEAAIHD